jgi:hypothetical protein
MLCALPSPFHAIQTNAFELSGRRTLAAGEGAGLDAASLSRFVEPLPRFAVGTGWAIRLSFRWAPSASESLRPTSAQHAHCHGKRGGGIPLIFQYLDEREHGCELAMHYTA